MKSDIYASYRAFTDAYVPLNTIEWALFKNKLTLKRYKKGETIHYAGDICDTLLFIGSGLVRLYIIDENGKDHTWNICFNDENAQMLNLFVVDYDSFVNQTASQISFEVLEDCALLSLGYEEMQQMYRQLKKSERFGRLMAEMAYSYTHNLVIDRLTKSAKERYEILMSRTPALLEKVPQYHIASYLGITPQHLSRLRKNTALRDDEPM